MDTRMEMDLAHGHLIDDDTRSLIILSGLSNINGRLLRRV